MRSVMVLNTFFRPWLSQQKRETRILERKHKSTCTPRYAFCVIRQPFPNCQHVTFMGAWKVCIFFLPLLFCTCMLGVYTYVHTCVCMDTESRSWCWLLFLMDLHLILRQVSYFNSWGYYGNHLTLFSMNCNYWHATIPAKHMNKYQGSQLLSASLLSKAHYSTLHQVCISI